MEETHVPQHNEPPKRITCIECDSPAVVKGYPNALCEHCREKFIKYPIPNWIKIFAAAVAVLLAFSMYKLPGNVITAMHLEKGKTALEEKKFLTAQKELEKADASIPGHQETESYLLVAAYHNQDMATFLRMFSQLKDKTFEDQELFNQVNDKIDQAQYFLPDDQLNELIRKNDSNISKIPIDTIKAFTEKYPENIYALYYYAGLQFNKEDYISCDSTLQKLLRFNIGYVPALELMTTVKRQENQLEQSIIYCNKILAENKESVFAMASKSRTLLKQKLDAKALALAQECVQLDADNPYAEASLLLAYHFNKKQKEEADLLKKMDTIKDSVYIQTVQYAKDVMSGKEIFRN